MYDAWNDNEVKVVILILGKMDFKIKVTIKENILYKNKGVDIKRRYHSH